MSDQHTESSRTPGRRRPPLQRFALNPEGIAREPTMRLPAVGAHATDVDDEPTLPLPAVNVHGISSRKDTPARLESPHVIEDISTVDLPDTPPALPDLKLAQNEKTPQRRTLDYTHLDTTKLPDLKLAQNGKTPQKRMLDHTHLDTSALPPMPLSMPGLSFAQNGQTTPGRMPDYMHVDTIQTAVLKSIAKEQGQPAPAMQSEISGAASNAGFVAISNIVGYFLKYANNILYQRGLGVGFYGLYTLSTAVISLIAAVLTLGLDDAMIRFIAIYRGKKQPNLLRGLTIFCTVLSGIAGLVGGVLVVFFALSIAAFEHQPEVLPFLLILGPTVPLMTMGTIWSGGLQGFKEFKKRVLVAKVYLPIVGFLLVLFTVIFFRNVTFILIATAIGTLLGTIGNLYYFFLRFDRTGIVEEKPEKYALREWFGFAAPNFLTTIVAVVLDSIDTLLLGYFAVSSVALGQYGAAIKVTTLIAMPLNSLNTMFAPTIAELHSKGEHEKLSAMFKIVTKWAITFSLPIFLITTLFAAPFLAISGDDYAVAWPLVIAFAIGSLMNAGTGPVGYMLLMTGKANLSFLNSLVAIISNVAFGIVLTPRYGAMGIAVATGLSIVVVNAMRLLQVRLLLKMHPYRWDILKPIGAAILTALVTGILLYAMSYTNLSFRLYHFHLYAQLLLMPVSLALYAWFISRFKVSPEDRVVLDRLAKKFKIRKKQRNVAQGKG